jgi:hypothetical protein
VQPDFSNASRVAAQPRRQDKTAGDMIGAALGGLSF